MGTGKKLFFVAGLVGLLGGVAVGLTVKEGEQLIQRCLGGDEKACNSFQREMISLGSKCGGGDFKSCEMLQYLQRYFTQKIGQLMPGMPMPPGFAGAGAPPVGGGVGDGGGAEVIHANTPKEAVEELRKRCNSGKGSSCVTLGQFYQYGYFTEKNGGEALKYYEKGCENGDPEGCYRAGLAWSGEVPLTRTPPNKKKALHYFQLGCKLKNRECCEKVGELIAEGVQ